MADLKSLKIKRGNIKGQLTRFEKFLSEVREENLSQLSERIRRCEEMYDQFNKIQEQIEEIDETELQKNERDIFEESYYKLIGNAKKLMGNQNAGEIAAQLSSGSDQKKVKKVKLPTIEITPFYGSYKSWLEFRDAFTSMVDNDEELTPVQKFFYLKSLVKGAAAEVIQSLEVCDENYIEAWHLLQDSFENNKLIALSHIESICEFPSMQKESYTGLKRFLDEIRKTVRVLKSLKLPVDTWDVLLIYLLEKKLDPITKNEWKKKCSIKSFQTMPEFIDFLAYRCQYLYSNNPREGKFGERGNFHKNQIADHSKGSKSFVTSNETCFLCKQPHQIFQCKTFIELPIQSKRNEIKKANLCWNCLRRGHIVQNCTSKGCKHCGKKHNSLLHADNPEQTSKNTSYASGNQPKADSSNINTTQEINNETTSLTANVKVYSEILLSTALVFIKDKFGKSHECRALLDSGSQSNFLTKDLCDRLQLSVQKTNVPVAGINQIATSVSYITNATVASKINGYHINSTFLVLNKITDNLPVTTVNTMNLNIPENIKLADTTFNKSGKIDILLGATIFWDLLCVGQIRLGKGLPIIQKTKFGWVISGTVPPTQSSLVKHKRICNYSVEQNDSLNLQDQLEKFWKIENVQNHSILSKEERECEDIFVKTTERNDNGRFIVNLPLRDNLEELGNSYTGALKRFDNLEKRLAANEEFGKQYRDFMKEYENLGHMTKIDDPWINETQKVVYYLPHHGVLRETSQTTKLRVVFDGSAETDTGFSLNHKLMVGPKIQDDLFDILIRFRKYNCVIAADVEKMYRQVLIKEEHRDLQRILWRPSINEPVCHYHLNTVTYGTASASFLAIRCLQQLGLDNKDKFPAASRIILKDFYVDDLLSGAQSWEITRQLRQELSAILDEAGFPLRKWLSNDDRVLEDKINRKPQIEHFISDDKVTKTLGLLWNSNTDVLQYKVNLHSPQCKTTKRSILSVVSQIFDPLGLVGPTIIKAKILLQKLWQLKFSWDEAVPLEIHTIWVQFLEQIDFINMKIRIPRQVICKEPIDIQLHGFCDASMSAYGACIFIRSTDASNSHEVRLLCAKSRVSPLKTISLPRLELCGAHLLAKLTKNVLHAIDLEVNKVHLWCDSTIVLAWIAGEPSQWKTFVANRTSEIQQITEGYEWRHVISDDNPADILSRGMDPRQLADCELWWNGPSWLQLDENYWSQPEDIKHFDIPEQKKLAVVSINHIDINIFDKFSSLIKLQRVLAYCLRFKSNTTTHKDNKLLGVLTVNELNDSLNLLIKLAQLQEFSSDINSLKQSKRLSTSSKLLSLNPFLDDSGIMRVGGRLQNADITYNQKHQILLPRDHKLTKLIILHEHYKNLHSGPQALLANIRLKYWIPSGRSTIRKIIHKCIVCFRNKPRDYNYVMGNLPRDRVTPSRPFTNCGVDYAGPFETKSTKLRNRKLLKSYLCIFICFATKAVHLELVNDLTTDSFLNCFKRFTSRRGLCRNIYSDNGTNFVGAANSLKELFEFINNPVNHVHFSEYLSKLSISWHFIPPRSPHLGGLWESAVKSAKYHLRRVIGNAILTFEELYTVVSQVEACLNSRPLTPLTENPYDLDALTPGHFLIGTSLSALPQEDVSNFQLNRLSRYQFLTQMIQHFWTRWSKDYLSSLQSRGKWRSGTDTIQPGMLVLLKDNNLPPLKWQLGRVTELHPGADSVCRVVSVKTREGVFKRAMKRLCVLPVETDFQD